MSDFYDYPARTICEVLKEMRSLDNCKYYNPMRGLIEELQILANRMEAHLDTQKTYFHLRDEIRKMKNEYKQLKEQIDATKTPSK